MQGIRERFMSLVVFTGRRLYRWGQRLRLKNRTPAIICNNCFGGLVYHNLGLRFCSPTIDLYFTQKDYMAFLQGLEGYLQADLREVTDAPESFPVGELTCDGKSIRIYFMHYRNFAEARQKWDARRQRVDLNNVYIIWQTMYLSPQDAEAFERLPWPNKMVIAKNNPTDSPCVQTLEVLAKPDYRMGEILEYKSRFSLQRHMDDVDYIGFLNTKNER